jgi:photoactive yellow protein
MIPAFGDATLLDWLEQASAEDLDQLGFGVVAMGPDGVVAAYNRTESALSGLTPSRVVGRHFFTSVAPCTNNHLVAQRFETETELDAVIDYVFTLRMAPTPVRLRLLRHPSARRLYLLVARRQPHGD